MKCLVCDIAITDAEVAGSAYHWEPFPHEAFVTGRGEPLTRSIWFHERCWSEFRKLQEKMKSRRMPRKKGTK